MQYILSLALALSFSLAFFQCDTAKSGNSAAKNSNAVTNTASQITAPQAEEAPRITLADAKADFDAGRAIFVDSRPAESYNVEHIKGSINVPFGDAEAKYKDIPTNKKIIVYCS